MKNSDILKAVSDVFAELADEYSKSVVCVENDAGSWRSGLILDRHGILTVASQAEEGERVTVLLPGGKEASVKVSGYDAKTELALLSSDEELPVAPLRTAGGLPKVGALTIALAYPSPEGVEARLGMIRCVSGGDGGRDRYFQTDSGLFPGFAGGPVVNTDGAVLGITAMAGGPSSGYVIPIEDALSTAKNLAAGGSTKYAYLGIRTMPMDAPSGESDEADGTAGGGLIVVGVEPDSPAKKAGFIVGDILVSLNGEPVSDHRDLLRIISSEAGGREMKAEILRAGDKKAVTVVTGTRSESVTRRHGGRGGWHGTQARR